MGPEETHSKLQKTWRGQAKNGLQIEPMGPVPSGLWPLGAPGGVRLQCLETIYCYCKIYIDRQIVLEYVPVNVSTMWNKWGHVPGLIHHFSEYEPINENYCNFNTEDPSYCQLVMLYSCSYGILLKNRYAVTPLWYLNVLCAFFFLQ